MRVRQRKSRQQKQVEAQGAALVGMVDAAMIIACADGELSQDEVNVVGEVIDGFFDGNVSRNEINEMLNLSLNTLEEQGLEARMQAVAANLQSDELRQLGLMAAAAVALADQEGDEDEEDDVYYDLASALGFSEDEADEIWDEVASQYE
jgi:tellurite resistance protein